MSEVGILVNVVASSLIGFLGTVGNILVIVAFFSVRSLRTINNMFVLQLAFVDLMKSSIILSTKSINLARGATSMNAGFCQISGILRTIGSCQSAVLLATIAVVRYFKVVRPRTFEKIFTFKKTLIYCGSIFAGTFLLALMPVIGLGRYRFSKSHGACFVNWDKINLVFRSIYYLINVGITFPVLIFCYLKIFQKLREHSRAVTPRINRKGKSTVTRPKIQVSSASTENNADMTLENVGKIDENDSIPKQSLAVLQPGSPSMPASSLKGASGTANADKTTADKKKYKLKVKRPSRWFRMKREKSDVELEVTRVMFAIVIAYTCCWMPAFAVNILNLSKVAVIPKDVLMLIVTLVDLKVCLNPLIYGIGSKQFRNAFLTVLRQRRDRDSASTVSHSGSSKYVHESPSKSFADSTESADNAYAETEYV